MINTLKNESASTAIALLARLPAMPWPENQALVLVLLDVFPVFLLQHVSEDEENAEKGQYAVAKFVAETRARLAYPDHEADQISNLLVILCRGDFPRYGKLQLVRLMVQRLLALKFPQNVRHADIFKHGVVPAGRTLVVAVERAQIGVQPVGACAVF